MGVLKKFLPFLFILAMGSISYSDQVASTSFKGLNNNESSVIIGPEYAQDLLNVDVTPGGKSVKKRPGYGTYKDFGTPQPVKGGHHFFDASGNDVQIWGVAASLFGIVADGTPTQLVSSATINATWDCTDTQGFAYCVDSSRDAFIKTNGATISWSTTTLGTMIETTPDRIAVAGVAGSSNTIYISQSNTFTNFTTGVNETDAFAEVIASPGSELTHIKWGCGKLLWWKDQSFGYLDFENQYQAQVKIVSSDIGTLDNTSAIDPGGQVWFRGQNGHTYKYDCSVITKESIDISPNIQAFGVRTSNSWTQTTTADFEAGFLQYSTTTVAANSVGMGFSDSLQTSTAAWTALAANWTASAGTGFSANAAGSIVKNSSYSLAGNYFTKVTFSYGTQCSSNTFAMVNTSTAGYYVEAQRNSNPSGCTFYSGKFDGTTFTSLASSVTASSSRCTTAPVVRMDFVNSGLKTIYFDDVQMMSFTDTTYSNSARPYFNITDVCGGGGGLPPFSGFKDLYVNSSSGTFYSAVKNAPSFRSWSTLEVNYAQNPGTNSFYLRSSTSSFTVASATPSWTAQTPGNLISIATGTYFQLKDDYTVTVATANPLLYDFTINWFEGTVGQAYMIYFDNAIWESVAFGEGQTSNNYIFKFDLINDGWTLYNFGAGGMLVQDDTLYFGNVSSGTVFNFGTSTSDNGTAMQSYWRSKSFTGGDPFLQSALSNIDLFAKKDQGSTLTGTYTTDTSSSTAYSISLSSANAVIQSRKLLPSGKLGYTFDYKFGDTSTSSAWEVLGYRIGFSQQPYRPGN